MSTGPGCGWIWEERSPGRDRVGEGKVKQGLRHSTRPGTLETTWTQESKERGKGANSVL